MTYTPHTTPERREAIRRAARAVVRLATVPEAKEAAHRQNAITGDVAAYTDTEAWDAVAALESMVYALGLVSAEEVEADRLASQTLARAELAAQLLTTSQARR